MNIKIDRVEELKRNLEYLEGQLKYEREAAHVARVIASTKLKWGLIGATAGVIGGLVFATATVGMFFRLIIIMLGGQP